MKEPEFIFNWDLFDSAKEAIEKYRNYANNFTETKPMSFLSWFCLKFKKPTVLDSNETKDAWTKALKKFNKLRSLQNRDAWMWKANVSEKDLFDAWMKWEVNNPKRGKSIADKRWIVDWLFDPLNKEMDEEINNY